MAHSIEVNGEFASSLVLRLPGFGVGSFDVDITLAKKLNTDPLGLVVKYDGLTLVGSVVSQYKMGEGFRVAAVLGAYGWHKPTKGVAYQDPSGVKRSTIISALERATGETVDPKPVGTVGQFYVEPAGTAAHSLNALAGGAWYVGLDGKTRLGKWPPSVVKSRFEVTGSDTYRRILEIGADSFGEWLPGAAFSHPRTAAGVIESVVHTVSATKYRATCVLKRDA